MQDRSTMTMVEYRSSIFWKVVIGFVWYKGLLFRTLLPLGTRASLVVLAGVLVGMALGEVAVLFTVRKHACAPEATP